ncbi:M20/M25/M40 family metallo-hydrolase [Natrarchaeobius oligotrophus]|uniref:M20/M25/M40 family metallo-hydrolase n=1 Tax=Natrarchaeobius chitinivorans TaxID=1679083 RepID=A0A3N6NR68_NATCH|nr:M20/M25/M40 family metallo-hydrolase [Natrarchaeobius chitinivorans]RQH02453.1 M20/M25/M40 family metallo-hydrolase [Natrarchaeobius chitinivorans]
MDTFEDRYGDDLRQFVDTFLAFESTRGNELAAQQWFREQLSERGFETYEWTADPDELASIPTFPDAEDIPTADRPSVAGVLEFGDPSNGRTLILNGHVDVVPVDETSWETDPFEPTWDGDRLVARGAADMKSNLAACLFVAEYLRETLSDVDGRIVVESVTGEEEGGIGAPAAMLSNPYPFERDAAIVAEPTELNVVTAIEGVLMKELRLQGRSAHAATRWRGQSVLPLFEEIRGAFRRLEAERHKNVHHPLYEGVPIAWPVNFGTVEAGSWTSNVPAELTSEVRIGVAPGETIDEVERQFEERLADVVSENEWLRDHPPKFERRAIQFEPSEIDPDEEVVRAVQGAMIDNGLSNTEPRGQTYSSDSRFYVEAGIPSVIFGAGTIDQAHFPNESVRWSDVLTGGQVIADAARAFLSNSVES